jgi:hypothetical protein
MQESGFVEQPWLIERDYRFIQVPELLFRVAEAADGQRTLDEIADHLTRTTKWIMSSEVVQQIIETKLALIGIVVLRGSLERQRSCNRPVRRCLFGYGRSCLDPVSSNQSLRCFRCSSRRPS